MSNLLLAAAALPLAGLAWWWLRPSTPPAVRPGRQAALRSPAPAPAIVPSRVEAPGREALPKWHWRTEEEMEPDKRDRLLAAIHDIPRPPHALARMLSPEFMAKANSNELSELVQGEPWIAARMLARVNSPLYGLRQPVTDLGQAVTFLGLQSVRSICLQTLMAEALQPTQPGVQKTFDTLWLASAMASELGTRLDKAMNQPAPGTLVTQVVLSFVGALAMASLIPPTGLSAWLQRDRLARLRLEQDLLGLGAAEIGHLLLVGRWSLPTALANDVRDAGRMLGAPRAQMDTPHSERLALVYLCTRLGERLALGQMASLEGYRLADDDAVDMLHVRTALAPDFLTRLDTALASATPMRTAA
ncbi:MAG: HDOD domain-containing protein [Hydrogenophaga sp.]|uniref:HDOD domain-containing protein n=1 Tax=Hydrogenophaga sp. TaxID=1904254 RepID=UPI003D0C46A7